MKKKLVACLVGISIFVNSIGTSIAFGDKITDVNNKIKSLENKLKNNNGNISNVKESISDIEYEIQDIEIRIEKLDNERELIQEKIYKNESDIKGFEDKIDELNLEIEKQNEILDEKKAVYSKIVRFMYDRGVVGVLESLFSLDSFEGFMSLIALNSKVNKQADKLLKEITETIEGIEANKETIKVSIEKAEDLRAENKRNLAQKEEKLKEANLVSEQLESTMRDYRATLRKYSNEETDTQRQLREARALVDQLKREAERQKNAAANAGTKGTTTGEQIIELASTFLGDPYLWGGTKPYNGSWKTGFDCSGLVQYVYRQFGIETGRVTYQQIKWPTGRRVERADLQAGDLVFFGSWSDPHHVGLYVGNNTYLHAPKTGDVVKISVMNRRDYLVGRRFLPD